jgi:predicted nuclease of predicted toxin-antitoxin system
LKIIVDMNLSPDWVATLRNAGFEAIHWSNIGLAFAPDEEIMSYATSNGYMVLTNDLDFGSTLVMTRAGKPSVVQLRVDDLDPLVLGQRVIGALRELGPELMEGALVTVEETRIRLRRLASPEH